MMDEPYVIGVRLALEDGVSAGMARMSETMKATSAMLAGLGPLPHAGGQGPAAALIGQAREGARQLTAAPPAAEPIPAGSPAAAERVIERYQTRTREITNSELRTLPPAPPAPLMRTEMQPVARAIERVVSRAAPVADAPWVPPPRETATGPAWAAPARAHVAEPVMLPVLRGFNDRAPAAEAAAPQAMAMAPMERTGLPALAPQLAAALPAMAPSAAPASDSGGGGGAVYLDGLLVGRWMEERLARAAGRPSGGATGFDPRMGPSWPGALQGG